MFFKDLRDLSFIWPFREANTRMLPFQNSGIEPEFVERGLFTSRLFKETRRLLYTVESFFNFTYTDISQHADVDLHCPMLFLKTLFKREKCCSLREGIKLDFDHHV